MKAPGVHRALLFCQVFLFTLAGALIVFGIIISAAGDLAFDLFGFSYKGA
jgi:hypothetical protein